MAPGLDVRDPHEEMIRGPVVIDGRSRESRR
jgi:hypothetical protein